MTKTNNNLSNKQDDQFSVKNNPVITKVTYTKKGSIAQNHYHCFTNA